MLITFKANKQLLTNNQSVKIVTFSKIEVVIFIIIVSLKNIKFTDNTL